MSQPRPKGIAVIGLGFGDEGKGRVVDYLAQVSESPAVIRFSGGPQAAHHVVTEKDQDHVFAHFGSGTLRGARTYWSKFCSVNPVAFMRERRVLVGLGVEPVITINPQSPVITPYEIAWNANSRKVIEDGTCGMGIFATVRRERDNYHVLFEDLYHPMALRRKVDALRDYYMAELPDDVLMEFYKAVVEMTESEFVYRGYGPGKCKSVIFEGSQGLLLDQNYGFFPHVTPSNTGATNLVEAGYEPEIWLVTRAYQTRHGAGPMSKQFDVRLRENPYEVNGDDGPQGEFRETLLDLAMLRYAVSKDRYIDENEKTLVITCMDIIEDDRRLYDSDTGKVIECASEGEFVHHVARAVGAEHVLLSRSATGNLEEVHIHDQYGILLPEYGGHTYVCKTCSQKPGNDGLSCEHTKQCVNGDCDCYMGKWSSGGSADPRGVCPGRRIS